MTGTPLVGELSVIFQEDVDFNSTDSESVMTKIAKAALFSQSIAEYPVNFTYSGRFRNTLITTGAERFVITKRSRINRYVLSIGKTGISVKNALNINIYDSDGIFVNKLFTSPNEPSILTTGNVNNSFAGMDILSASNIESGNLGGAGTVINNGTLNVTTLEEGWQLIGEISSNAEAAEHADLELTLQRIE